MKRHFYAIYSPADKSGLTESLDMFDTTANRLLTLYRYSNMKDRAEDIERTNRQSSTGESLMVSISSRFARKLFPEAFAHDAIVWDPWRNGDRCFTRPWWRDYEGTCGEWTGRPAF